MPLVTKHLKDITEDEIISALRPIFARPDATKIAHNVKFDWQMLKNAGITVTAHLLTTRRLAPESGRDQSHVPSMTVSLTPRRTSRHCASASLQPLGGVADATSHTVNTLRLVVDHRAELTVADRPGPAGGWPAEALTR